MILIVLEPIHQLSKGNGGGGTHTPASLKKHSVLSDPLGDEPAECVRWFLRFKYRITPFGLLMSCR